MVESINLDKNAVNTYREDELLKAKAAQTEIITSRDALTTPSANLTKAAQASTDIIVASGASGNLNQLVIEGNNPTAIQKLEDANVALNRNIGAISTQSAIGTQTDVNALPSEVNAKSGDF